MFAAVTIVCGVAFLVSRDSNRMGPLDGGFMQSRDPVFWAVRLALQCWGYLLGRGVACRDPDLQAAG